MSKNQGFSPIFINDINSKNENISKLTELIQIKNHQIASLKTTIEAQDVVIKNMQNNWTTEVSELNGKISELNKTIAEKDNKIAELQAELEKVSNDAFNALEENASLKAKIDELNSQITKLEDEKSIAQAEIDRLNKEVEKAKEDYLKAFHMWQTSDVLRAQAEKKVKELESQLNASKEESQAIVDKANEQISQANQDQDDIMKAIQDAKTEISNQ